VHGAYLARLEATLADPARLGPLGDLAADPTGEAVVMLQRASVEI
jgi:hypothetical protein